MGLFSVVFTLSLKDIFFGMGVSDWPSSPLRVKPTLGLNYIQNLLIGDLQKKYVKSDEKFNLQQCDQILLSVLLQFSQTPSNLLPILLQFSQTPSNLLPILLQFSQPKFYLKLNSFISTTRVSWRRYKEHTISRWTHPIAHNFHSRNSSRILFTMTWGKILTWIKF